MLDYYYASVRKECKLVKTQDKDTILYKNGDEYTSPLKRVFQIDASVTATGKDIAGLIIQFMEKNAKRGKTRTRGKG